MNKAKVWKRALVALSVAAILVLFSYMALWDHYWDTLPRSPDQAAGRVYVDNFHGVAVYETRQERFRLHALENASEILIALTAVAGIVWDRKTRRSRG